MGGFWHLNGCSGSGIGVGCRFGRFTWAGAGCFGAFWALRKELGEGLLVRSGDPKSVFRSFSWVDNGTNGFLVRLGSLGCLNDAPGGPWSARNRQGPQPAKTQGQKWHKRDTNYTFHSFSANTKTIIGFSAQFCTTYCSLVASNTIMIEEIHIIHLYW